MFVNAMLICGVAFAAFTVFVLVARIRRRIARPVLLPWEPAFDPAEVQAMFHAGKITLGERDRLLVTLQKQRERKEAETVPRGPRGFPVTPLSESVRADSRR